MSCPGSSPLLITLGAKGACEDAGTSQDNIIVIWRNQLKIWVELEEKNRESGRHRKEELKRDENVKGRRRHLMVLACLGPEYVRGGHRIATNGQNGDNQNFMTKACESGLGCGFGQNVVSTC